MAVEIDLTPTTIDSADYPTAQTPLLGGELKVYLTTEPTRILGTGLLTADGVISWKYVLPPSANPPGPIAVVAIGGGVQQVAADTITYAGLTGSFTPVGWSSNTTFDFPVGRAVELTGTYAAPTSSSVPTLSLTPGAGMKRGSQFAIIELPAYADFVLAGCTTERNISVPSRGSKNIPCGMEASEWTTPGMTTPGELSITGVNQGPDDGLIRYAGVKCQAMVCAWKESRIETFRAICTDWTPQLTTAYPTGDTEATAALSGAFSKFVMFPAP